MKLTNQSASVVVLVDLPAFQPGETRDIPDAIAAQLLTRAEFVAVDSKAEEPHKKAKSITS
jgi:hypothetical protein